MLRQEQRAPARHYQASDRDLDALVLRLRRLALHRGYDRGQLVSPMLKRLMPLRKPMAGPAADMADLHRRVAETGLDRNTIAYLTQAVESELDAARLRLT